MIIWCREKTLKNRMHRINFAWRTLKTIRTVKSCSRCQMLLMSKFSRSRLLFLTEPCVRISLFGADGGWGCLASISASPDGWRQSDTRTQQQLNSLRVEFESGAAIFWWDLTVRPSPAPICCYCVHPRVAFKDSWFLVYRLLSLVSLCWKWSESHF